MLLTLWVSVFICFYTATSRKGFRAYHIALRSFKIVGIGTNQKPICVFLLVFHCNYMPVLYRFQDITIYCCKIYIFAIFTYPLKPLQGVPRDPWYESWSERTRDPGLPDGENCTILWSVVLIHYHCDRQTDRHTACG